MKAKTVTTRCWAEASPSAPAPAVSPPAKPCGRSSAPLGPMFCRSRHGCAAPGPQRQSPGACSRSVAFRCAKPRWPVIGPTFWVCRAKSRAAFRCAKPPCAVVRFAAMASPPRTAILPFPSRLRRAGAPTAKPRRLSPFGSISLRETALAGHRPHLLGLPRKIARGISLRETTLCGCPLRGHGFATPHRYFAVPVTAAPRRGPNGKTPALVAVRLHFAARNRAGRSSAPPGPMFCRSRHGCAAPGPQRQNPGACRRSAPFRCAKPRWPVIGPTGADVLPFPSRLRRAGAPTAKPRRPLPAFLTLRK